MDRPELWGLIDRISYRQPPGGHHRLTHAELIEWLAFVADNPRADRCVRKDAKTALKWVPKLIGSHFEVANTRLPEPMPEPKKEKRSIQLSLFE